jgi:aryl-alcohol dehydrogenase-like predicted oxidoreductase
MVDDRVAAAARDAEAAREVDVEWVRHEAPPKNPSAVYSVRIPAERIEQLRQVAAERGVQPTALIRAWVLAQLDAAGHEDEQKREWEQEVRATVTRLKELLDGAPLANSA